MGVVVPSDTWSCALDVAAVRAAIDAGLCVERMPVNFIHISFSYPMRKQMQAFSLLDVAVCLGEASLAKELAARVGYELAVQGSLQSVLSEVRLAHAEDGSDEN